ncbi:MAG TPA: long-chain fatty acid--CoA ligase [Polyangia bacterium]|nr:long-chain fatty acid--CoA ligase [Polyangia bacterium]
MSAPSSILVAPPQGAAPNVMELRKNEPRSAVEMWRRRVAKTPTRPAFRLHDGAGWKVMTFAEADAAARELAAGLVAAGLAPGDRVCLLSQTRVEWALCDVAILMAGGVTVPIYGSNTAEQCEFIVRDAGAKLVIVEDDGQRDKIASIRGRLPGVGAVVQIAGDPPRQQAQTLAELQAAGRKALGADPALLANRGEPGPDSLFTIVYTSGTTGTPKGVVLTHDNLVASMCSGGRAINVGDNDEQYLFLPLAHILGREMVWAGFELGYTTAFSRGTNQIREDLVAVRPTFMAGVPRIYEKFYSAVTAAMKQGSPTKQRLAAWAVDRGRVHAAAVRAGRSGGGFGHWLADKLVLSKLRARLGLDRCRFLISGGAPLAPEIAEFFHAAGLLILEGYGLTETTSAVFLNTPERFRFGTVGPALDVIESRIAEDGEILVRGAPVFRRYYNNAEATAEAVEPDGWFHTGDIGVFEDGFLRITDRKKDLIVTAGGKKVAPQPLESALKAATPLVAQVLVYGDKRPFCVALVTPSEVALKQFGPDAAASPELKAAIQKALDGMNARLASFETVKRFAILPGELTEAAGELTPKMSVKRKVVVEKYRALIDALYSGPGPAEHDG